MHIEWFGQSAYLLTGSQKSVMIDPFVTLDAVRARGYRWEYPDIPPTRADLLLVTHEHPDHNGAEAVVGEPMTIRSTAGRFESPIGTVTAIASEHDPEAGTLRGANVIMSFELDGIKVCHFGDFGQTELRPEQAVLIGQPDLLFIPVGGQSTIDGLAAAAIVAQLKPRWVIPMHYRTEAISFLGDAETFLSSVVATEIVQQTGSTIELDRGPDGSNVSVLVLAPPAPVSPPT